MSRRSRRLAPGQDAQLALRRNCRRVRDGFLVAMATMAHAAPACPGDRVTSGRSMRREPFPRIACAQPLSCQSSAERAGHSPGQPGTETIGTIIATSRHISYANPLAGARGRRRGAAQFA